MYEPRLRHTGTCLLAAVVAALLGSCQQPQAQRVPHALPEDIRALLPSEPLKVKRADGKVYELSLAEVYEHHEKEHHHGDPAHAHDDDQHHVCLGVTIAYRAIEFATARLFGEDVPVASDMDISVAGPMPGMWDTFALYLGRDLAPVPGKVAPRAFTFTATRKPTGKTVRFKVRDGMIPPEFFLLKRAVKAADTAAARESARDKLEAAKRPVIKRFLSTPPSECFTTAK